jgi:ferric-dicitrate binding protein FerR (iron transport regulator)
MSGPKYARLASRALAQADRDPVPPPSPLARASAIGAIERAIAQSARAKRRARWLGALAAAAAAVAVLGGAAHYTSQRSRVAASSPPQAAPASGAAGSIRLHDLGQPLAGAASVVVGGVSSPASDDGVVPAGGRVVTAKGGRVLLAFSTGTSAVLAEGSNVTLDSLGALDQLRLEAGSLDLHVTKRGPAERFVVKTADSEVEVRGTQFRVWLAASDAACGAGTPTRVAVSEGVVVVRHGGSEARVGAGETWPSGCPEASAAVAAPSAAASSATNSSTPAAAASTSVLAAQNDLFAQAIAAKRRGDAASALAILDRLLARYPGGPLAETAAVERMRLLRTSDPARAASAARAYLARYPIGFAHAEADAILAGSP